MLGVFKFIVICMCCLSACLWTPLKANSWSVPWVILSQQQKDPTDICLDSADSMENTFDLQELIRLIVELRDYMVSTGCYFPRLTTLLDTVRDTLRKDGVEIDDLSFDALKAEFAKHDCPEGCSYQPIKHKHKKHHKKEKEMKISSRMACGFLKFVGGTLLCFIPIGPIQGAGASLAIVGVSEMVDAARQESDKKEWEERLDANRRIDHAMDQY